MVDFVVVGSVTGMPAHRVFRHMWRDSSTIKLAILRRDGAINTLTLPGVLYAPDMFLSCISHSKIRAKGYFYHG